MNVLPCCRRQGALLLPGLPCRHVYADLQPGPQRAEAAPWGPVSCWEGLALDKVLGGKAASYRGGVELGAQECFADSSRWELAGG